MFSWALESVCAVVFDRRIGCLAPDLASDSWQMRLITSLHDAFEVFLKLMFHPREKIMEKCGIESKTWKIAVSNLRCVHIGIRSS